MRGMLLGMGAVLTAGTVLAVAQPAPGQGGGPERAAIRAQLGLSDAQEAELRQLRGVERKAAVRRRAEMAIARIELAEALDAAAVDEKLVAAKAKTLSELQGAAVQARVNHQLALRKLLTAEQYAKMKELRHDRRAHRGAIRGHRRPGRGLERQPHGRGPQAGGFGGPNAPADAPDEEDEQE